MIRNYNKRTFDEELETSLEIAISRLSGYTTYQIGGTIDIQGLGSREVHFPISKLEFPLDVYLASLRLGRGFGGKWIISSGVKKNITNDAGSNKDSDWGFYWLRGEIWARRDTLDIYSECNADLDALIFDINLRYTFDKKIKNSFFAGLGYIHQKFNYEVNNLDQSYPSYYYYFGEYHEHDYVSGKVGAYKITYSIPYIEIGTRFKFKDKFYGKIRIDYSTIVSVEDENNHILRSISGKGDCSGTFILFSLKGYYSLPENWFLTLKLDFTMISTDGRKKQYKNGELSATIDQEIESEQLLASLALVYMF